MSGPMSECPRGFHQVNHVCPCAFPRRAYQMKYGTQIATIRTIASTTAVWKSIAQPLLVIGPHLQGADLSGLTRPLLEGIWRALLFGLLVQPLLELFGCLDG